MLRKISDLPSQQVIWKGPKLLGKWKRLITGKGIGHSRVCQHGRAAGKELDEDDKEPHDGSAFSATGIEKDLRCWHPGRAIQDRIQVIDAKTHRHREHPAKDAGDKDGNPDRHRPSDGRIMGFF